jgi:hypothetical protein
VTTGLTGLTTGVATTGVTTGVATTGGVTTGVATTGVTTGVDTTGSTTGTTCPDAAAPVACSPTSSGGLALMSNYLPASGGIGMGGYAYAYGDWSITANPGTSTSCISSTQLCAKGTIDLDNYTATLPAGQDHYGAGIGFNLNQAQAMNCESPAIMSYTVPSGSMGISYTLSNLPMGGARLIIGNAVTAADGTVTGTDYCVALPTASGTIPWSQFNSECWTDQGTFLTGPPAGPIHINIGLPSSATTTSTFDFCVTAMSFATSVTAMDSGTASTCNGSMCCQPTSGPSASGDGSFTCYTFKQGTANNKPFCGYAGSEAAYTGGGTGACQSQNNTAYTDTVPNVGPPSDYFMAFPGPGGSFGNGTLCGLCINVTYAGKTLMGTVVDECPSGSNPLCGVGSNHLDLSASLARDLGIGVGTVVGNPSNVTWAAVACPISSNGGHIVEVFNGSATQVYFQNVVWPVMSVKVNGTAATQSNGYWLLPSGSGPISLTDTYGHTITGTLPGTNNGSLGIQFPATCP